MINNNFTFMEEERNRYLEEILVSNEQYKIIVAGPGTGKTYTFKRLLEKDPGNSLVLTFINNLVHQLQEEIGNLADVRTFHSFSRAILHKQPFEGITSSFHYFPNIYNVVSQDSIAISKSGLIHRQYSTDEFKIAFRNLDLQNDSLKFFIKLSNYYDTVGFDDSVYRILCLFQKFNETIPNYKIVMVDEYQDFNLLEIELLNKLEIKNKILIVGDDDQSIYQFREASPDYLRKKVEDTKFSRYSLPYCSRCTSVVIELTNNIISKATSSNLLNGRIEKEFLCYLPEKFIDNVRYPKIQKVEISVHRKNTPYISKYIEKTILNIPEAEITASIQEQYPLVLIIGKDHYLKSIYDYLQEKFPNVEYEINKPIDRSILIGYKHLFRDGNSNLGWRLIIEDFLPEKLDEYIVEAYKTGRNLVDLLDQQFINEHLKILEIIKKIRKKISSISNDETDLITKSLKLSIEEISNNISGPVNDKTIGNVEQINEHVPKIVLANFCGSKGLSAGYTFITGIDEGNFPANVTPTDIEVCQFVVAVTRTRKQCHIIHANQIFGKWKRPSEFWDWVPDYISETIKVNKDYFNGSN